VEKTLSALEQYIAGLLFSPLQQHCTAADIGRAFIETKFRMPGTRNDRQPDVAYLSYDRWAKDKPASRRNGWPAAPDLVVEVVSPTDPMFNVLSKLEEYFAAGVREVWHVLSNTEKVYCYSSPTRVRILTRADDLTGDPVVPGFRMPLADLFPPAEPPPAAEG
jgi:Uma2 family endonuclease